MSTPEYEPKTIRMLVGKVTKLGNGCAASAGTYGSGGGTSGMGIVDTRGYDVAVIMVFKATGFATKASWKIGYQSGPAALYSATCGTTTITSFLACGITASRVAHRYVANLRRLPDKMRYLNAKSVNCTTCGVTTVICQLFKGNVTPSSNNMFSTTRTW